ncbi:MAG TPA: alanine racemase [Propionibacteriaceae bacterium]|nr:alanine racemase [Propionibacteriaceae bacterium]
MITLRVDGTAWRAHQRRILAATPGLVPVAKGNGYGFGLTTLAAEAQALGVDTLAVGTAAEVRYVRTAFTGDVVVLQPWRDFDRDAVALVADSGVIHTVSRVKDLAALAATGERPRVLVEVLTSMRRFGVPADDLGLLAEHLDEVDLVGWTFHLPMAAVTGGNAAEAERLAKAALAVRQASCWFSHVTASDYDRLRASLFTDTRKRVGTDLWLGGSAKRTVTATVLDVHPVARGERIGYWQRAMPTDGHVVVVSGGTANGIALEAPTAASSMRQRLLSVATGSMEAVGLALSPYTIQGAKRWFVEPPHMQSSMVFLPAKVRPPHLGDEVPVEVRLTTAAVDRIVLE